MLVVTQPAPAPQAAQMGSLGFLDAIDWRWVSFAAAVLILGYAAYRAFGPRKRVASRYATLRRKQRAEAEALRLREQARAVERRAEAA